MYLVVSRWESLPGKEQEFEDRGRAVRAILRSTPGVKLIEGFQTENGQVVAILGYDSQESYERIVNDENGPFQKALAEHRLEECSQWISSERGEAITDA